MDARLLADLSQWTGGAINHLVGFAYARLRDAIGGSLVLQAFDTSKHLERSWLESYQPSVVLQLRVFQHCLSRTWQ